MVLLRAVARSHEYQFETLGTVPGLHRELGIALHPWEQPFSMGGRGPTPSPLAPAFPFSKSPAPGLPGIQKLLASGLGAGCGPGSLPWYPGPLPLSKEEKGVTEAWGQSSCPAGEQQIYPSQGLASTRKPQGVVGTEPQLNWISCSGAGNLHTDTRALMTWGPPSSILQCVSCVCSFH